MSNIVVLSCNYNGNIFVKNNIVSVFNQTLKPKKHYFIDDISTDGCDKLVDKTIKEYNIDNIEFIRNKQKKYKIKNLYNIIHEKVDDDDIVVIVDGDDWLYNENVLLKINEAYRLNNCKYCYSNFIFSHNNKLGISRKINNKNWSPYKDAWITSHISTFKASEFKKIKKENFIDNNNKWFEMGCDQAYILPILENIRINGCLEKDVFFINEPLYVYHHTGNPSKPRDGSLGLKAHNAVSLIRKRGLI